MIKRSFSENAAQALLPEHEKRVKLSEEDLSKIQREPCSTCDVDIEACHKASMDFKKLTTELHLRLLASPVGRRMFSPRRVVLYQNNGIRTPAILLREGTSGGFSPTLHILDVFSGRETRTTSDLLLNLPVFRRYFEPIPAENIKFKVSNIPLTDLECVTRTVLKIDLNGVLNHQADALEACQEDIASLCSSWDSPDWDELDWGKVKDLQVRDVLDARRKISESAQTRHCIECPQFLKHFGMRHDEWIIKENIAQIRQLMSDQNLQLLPDYEQRIAVLKDLGFIDEKSIVQLKGKVACEVSLHGGLG